MMMMMMMMVVVVVVVMVVVVDELTLTWHIILRLQGYVTVNNSPHFVHSMLLMQRPTDGLRSPTENMLRTLT